MTRSLLTVSLDLQVLRFLLTVGTKMNFSEVTMDMETLKVLSVVILVIRQAIMKTPVVLSPAK